MDQTNDATIVIVTKVTFDRSKEGDYTMSIEEIDNDRVSLPIMVLTQKFLGTFELPDSEYYNQLGYAKIQWNRAAALPPFIHKMQTTGYSGSQFETHGFHNTGLGKDDTLKFAKDCKIILNEPSASEAVPQTGAGKRTSKKKKRRSKKRKPTKKRKSSKKRKTAKKRRRN